MKKMFLATIVLLAFCASSQLFAQKIYNDGVIDYAPMAVAVKLNAFDADSDLKEIQYSVDGGALDIYAAPIKFDSEGRHFIAYRAVDFAGNMSKEMVYSLIVDDTAPEFYVSANGPAFMRDRVAYISGDTEIVVWGEDNLSGLDAIYGNVDGASYRYLGPGTIAQEGKHVAEAYAVDNVGNKSRKYRIEAFVDATPPEVTVTSLYDIVENNGKYYTSRNNVYTASAKDDVAGVEDILMSIDDSEFFSYVKPIQFQEPGEHTFRYKAIDKLGNVTNTYVIDLVIDMESPKTDIQLILE